MSVAKVALCYFSGTGNTWLAVEAMREVFVGREVGVRLLPIEHTDPAGIPQEGLLGLAFPIACGTTYPFVWRFLEALPEGEGRDVFMLDTLAGSSAGMVKPLGDLLRKKGYRPIGAREIRMPGNLLYIKPEAANAALREKALVEATAFAGELLEGKTNWPAGGFCGRLTCSFSRWLMSWWPTGWGKWVLRQVVDGSLCTRCGLCVRLCPVNAIEMTGNGASIGLACEYCQRCAAVCPVDAIKTNGKNYTPYRAVKPDVFVEPVMPDAAALESGKEQQSC